MTVMTSMEIRQLADHYQELHRQLSDFYIQNLTQLSEAESKSYDQSLKQFRKQVYALTAAAIDLDLHSLVNPIGKINQSIDQLQHDIQQVDQARAKIDLITKKIQGLAQIASAVASRNPTTIADSLQQFLN
ncbi:MAG: hypothetical protein KME16_11680 [Scytolyngbya sp. HA4215-MV1]|jgi:chromosome segregation ATPase|nr:hypothetical protein [Scytolyngbya sp. HA4215-MV1]